MKKFLAFTLSVLLVVCGVLPAFVANTAAADQTTLGGLGRTLPAEYADGNSLHFQDFAKDNAGLNFNIHEDAYGDSIGPLSGTVYTAKFYADVPGVYEFCFANWVRSDDTWNYVQADGTTRYPHAGTVRIDDGETYVVSNNTVLAAGESPFDGIYYHGNLVVELTAGEHTINIAPASFGMSGFNGAEPHFIDAYWYCAKRTGFYEEMPYGDALAVTEIDLTETKIPGTFKIGVPYNGTYSLAALIKKTTESAGALSFAIDDTRYYVYEIDGVKAGKSLYYDIAAGVELTAGEHTVTIGRYGAEELPTVEGLVLAATTLTGMSDTNPYPKATAVNFQAQYMSNTQSDADGDNWYSWNTNDYKPSIGKAGIWIIDPTYTYTATFTPAAGGEYSLAMYLAHRTSTTSVQTTSFTVTVSAGKETVGEYTFTEFTGQVNSQRYYDLAQGVRLEAGTEYTIAVQQAGETDSTIVDFLYNAETLDGISFGTNNPNVGFENATTLRFEDFMNSSNADGDNFWQTNSNFNYFIWAPHELSANGQFSAVDAHGMWMQNDTFAFNLKFTPDEDGEYSFSAFIPNKTTNTNGKDPLTSTVAGAFEVVLSDATGEIGTYTVTELQPAEVGSRIHYHFADGVALEAGTEYTISFRRTALTDSALVSCSYELTSVVEKAIEDSKKEDIVVDGDADEIPVGVINPLPGVGGAGAAENQPNMSVINPLPIVDENMNAPGMPEAEADSTTPPQPYGDAQLPAVPGGFGAHFQLAPMPAFMN